MKLRARFPSSLLLLSLLLLLFFTFTSAKRRGQRARPLPLASIHILDRNGFSETITNKERLNQFQGINFLSCQPYQKVLRIYARDSKGNIRSIITSYYPNGNPKQYLEILNARALGKYLEWHENGTLSIAAKVIGGPPDITPHAEQSWLFDGTSYVWDEEKHLIAELLYCQGFMEGVSTYYHPSGQIWKKIPYHKNQIHGLMEIRKDTGELLQRISYKEGSKQGTSIRLWDADHLACQEEYQQDKLESGQYFDKEGRLISQIVRGEGFRAIFGKESVSELQEYRAGVLEGEVKVFNSQKFLKRIYHIKDGIKHGEEIEYYDPVPTDSLHSSPQPRLSFRWYKGAIQGEVKTWYPNGVQESHREMAHNQKTGIAMAWYQDGSLMFIEEYEQNKLIKGEYFKKGENHPISQVCQGNGTATLFDSQGNFNRKISYLNGKPNE